MNDLWAMSCPDNCELCEPAEEHTDRQARQAEQDADSAAIDAEIEGHA